MKTKTKSTTRKSKFGKSPVSPPHRKQIESRDLNEDEQNRATNVPDEEEASHYTIPQGNEVEEEEREKKRRVEDARGEEEN